MKQNLIGNEIILEKISHRIKQPEFSNSAWNWNWTTKSSRSKRIEKRKPAKLERAPVTPSIWESTFQSGIYEREKRVRDRVDTLYVTCLVDLRP